MRMVGSCFIVTQVASAGPEGVVELRRSRAIRSFCVDSNALCRGWVVMKLCGPDVCSCSLGDAGDIDSAGCWPHGCGAGWESRGNGCEMGISHQRRGWFNLT